ncbi:glucose-1-phosphate adenylyltransferase [Anaerobranca californiensis DSM 14826]|jgi:glucose-1-phosphate adenylyltransferase|uniref:Glucose-1-phosphate adenylyltransferase n=2 Tax=Anaerobranca TaxID=42447 RepID=A0A1M6QIX7_9FIRM|nr:glucose-1-phosphate adenylyltransferase [Anaerobranca californiensis DSM 14826]
MKKECIALILAGGQGTRLGILTTKLAKPAVPFGGKYRIIDFTLSNCSNSGIDTVGVLTQYEPLILNTYIGIGTPWGLDKNNGGVTVLSPYVAKDGGHWYRGTADAVFQNIEYIELYNPDYVLILSGDHIYKMDYSYMIDYHKERNADLTIAAMKVDWEEAKRFGIIISDQDGKITGFQEKPAIPKNNLASMGIYIFNWKTLKEYLIEDNLNPSSSHDFGKDIIPKMLEDERNLMAYPFYGYWKDVGTIESFWEANMDLIEENRTLNLYDNNWRIYSVNPVKPPHYIGKTAKVVNSMITEGCYIEGTVIKSIIFPGTVIKKGAVVKESIVMPGVVLGENAIIEKAIIGENAIIDSCCQIGDSKGEITVIGEGTKIDKESVISSGCICEKDQLKGGV